MWRRWLPTRSLYAVSYTHLDVYKRQEQDYQLLSKRCYVNNIGDNFKGTVCIMSKNDEIERFNYEKLESNKQPVALNNAIHN